MDTLFKNWLLDVEDIVYYNIEMKLIDLPDEDFRMNYDSGVSAQYMADIVLDNYYSILRNYF